MVWNRFISNWNNKNQVLFLAWHGAIIETIVFLHVFEISGNLKSCQKVAIFKKYGTCIKQDRYVASFPDRLISNWNNEIPYAIMTVKFSLTVRVFCWDNCIILWSTHRGCLEQHLADPWSLWSCRKLGSSRYS